MKLKKLLATGLAAMMVMGLVGCSSSSGSSSAQTDKLQQINYIFSENSSKLIINLLYEWG